MSLSTVELEPALLACPRCRSALERRTASLVCSSVSCSYHEVGFRSLAGQPVLIDFPTSVLTEDDVFGRLGESVVSRRRSRFFRMARRALVPRNRVAERNVREILTVLGDSHERPTVLVIGGGVVGSGIGELYSDPGVTVVSFDVYASPLTQFIADAHRIPLADSTVDAVIIQAVLPCVLHPETVVNEVHRVLKIDGLVYSETSFLQQVCEGPYDFTRFTDSGHRFLYRSFDVIDSGVVAGPGTQALWTVDHLARGLFRSRTAGLVAKGLFSWLRYVDRLVPPPFAIDSAAAIFLLARKAEGPIDPHEIIPYYQGAQR